MMNLSIAKVIKYLKKKQLFILAKLCVFC